MARQNSISNASASLTIDPGASGDSYIQYSLSAVDKFRIGSDDDDSDSFKVSLGSSLGTNDALSITTAGQRRMALQSAFLAKAATQSNVTGDGTVYDILFSTETFDQNSDFSSPSFTAPVTGNYMFACNVRLSDVGGSHTTGTYSLVTSNRTYTMQFNPANTANAGLVQSLITTLADMDSSDTAKLTITVSGSTKTVDVNSGVAVFFSGSLIS